jgi:alanyl-tRNA synthetase
MGETVHAHVDGLRRADIQRNHTATHLLHRALRDVLGEHAAQAGSLVAPERLRFDFTHPRPITGDQLEEIERRMNAWVRFDSAVTWDTTNYQQALGMGATALFGEKYGDEVRFVHITHQDETPAEVIASRDSLELCGGTHVKRTGEIGLVRVVNESSIGSGLRRIEVLTGRGAETWVSQQVALLKTVASHLGVPPIQVAERVNALITEQKQLQKEYETLQSQTLRQSLHAVLDTVEQVQGVALIATQVAAPNATRLREMGDWLRDKLGSGVVVLGAVIEDKPLFLAMITPDLVKQGYHAGNLVKALAQIVGGGGGGKPDMAQAGGKDPDKLPEALANVSKLLRENRR